MIGIKFSTKIINLILYVKYLYHIYGWIECGGLEVGWERSEGVVVDFGGVVFLFW